MGKLNNWGCSNDGGQDLFSRIQIGGPRVFFKSEKWGLGLFFVKLELKFHPKLFIIPVRNYILIFHQPRMAEINQSINRDIGFDLFTFYCLQFGNISLSFYKNDTDKNLLATIKVMSNVYRCYK